MPKSKGNGKPKARSLKNKPKGAEGRNLQQLASSVGVNNRLVSLAKAKRRGRM